MSKSGNTPFILTLGFAAGLAAGAFLFREEVATATKPAPNSQPHPHPQSEPIETVRDAGTLAALEQTFQRWGGYAVWENDVTEIAAWDPRKRRHSDFIEIRRANGKFYFRTIHRLTRPLIDHGRKLALPIAFTEPQWMREKFHRENPGYDRDTEETVELPPRPPERFDRPPQRPFAIPPSAPPLTPGAGHGYDRST